MTATPSSAPAAVPTPATWPDQPRLARVAHWLTFLGILVPGLSVAGIVVAVTARRHGEFGADKALRNAVVVTALILVFLAVAAAFSFL